MLLLPGYISFVLLCCVSHSAMTNSCRLQWTAVHQTPLSMEFSQQDFCSCHSFSRGLLAGESVILHYRPDSLPTELSVGLAVCPYTSLINTSLSFKTQWTVLPTLPHLQTVLCPGLLVCVNFYILIFSSFISGQTESRKFHG